MRILIAEDEQRTRQGLVRVLQSLRDEYEIVAQASNGKAALEMILEQKPDVVFIDIKMPFMDGLSVIEAASFFIILRLFYIILQHLIKIYHIKFCDYLLIDIYRWQRTKKASN